MPPTSPISNVDDERRPGRTEVGERPTGCAPTRTAASVRTGGSNRRSLGFSCRILGSTWFSVLSELSSSGIAGSWPLGTAVNRRCWMLHLDPACYRLQHRLFRPVRAPAGSCWAQSLQPFVVRASARFCGAKAPTTNLCSSATVGSRLSHCLTGGSRAITGLENRPACLQARFIGRRSVAGRLYRPAVCTGSDGPPARHPTRAPP